MFFLPLKTGFKIRKTKKDYTTLFYIRAMLKAGNTYILKLVKPIISTITQKNIAEQIGIF